MQIKYWLAVSLIVIASIGSAQPLATATRNTACGNPLPFKDQKWCDCFHNFLDKAICKRRNITNCTDGRLTQVINGYGGIIAFCNAYSIPDLDARACVDQLIYYFEQCPLHG